VLLQNRNLGLTWRDFLVYTKCWCRFIRCCLVGHSSGWVQNARALVTFDLQVFQQVFCQQVWFSQSAEIGTCGSEWLQRRCLTSKQSLASRCGYTISTFRVDGVTIFRASYYACFTHNQRTASLSWQLMFLQSDGQTTSMSIPEAQRWGYSMMATSQRVILRSPFKQPHAEVTMVGTHTLRHQVFKEFPSHAKPVLPGLVGERAEFESRSFSLGLEGFLLDEATATSRGLSLVHQEGMVKIGVPFGSEGGFRKVHLNSKVSGFEISKDLIPVTASYRLKMSGCLLVVFLSAETISDHQEFTVYLGNIPTNVILEEIWINGQRLLMLGKPQQGLSISPIVHVNGSQAYELQLPFKDPVVQWTNVGGGVVQYSIHLNFTLTVVPQRQSYYHQNFITAQVFNACDIVKQSSSLWEVGIDHEPLTEQLVAQRGYRLHNDSHRAILEVPVFSVGYTYEDINLSNFYAMFKLLLRDSKTLEVQASVSKRCLFRTEDMIGGTVTVVATPTSTLPMVKPEKTSLLDHSCKPKQTDGARVLFEFKVDSCGTRAMVGEWYIVYENEILHDRLLIADGPNFISREPQFKTQSTNISITISQIKPLTSLLSCNHRAMSGMSYPSLVNRKYLILVMVKVLFLTSLIACRSFSTTNRPLYPSKRSKTWKDLDQSSGTFNLERRASE
ncbi:hypothetical protein GOODEAATRI_019290, partial [Goodea atripinnis]